MVDKKHQKLFVLIFILLVAIFFLYYVRSILFPFFIAIVIAYLVNPLIKKLLGRGFNRVGAIIMLFTMLLMLVLIFSVFVLPIIVDELNRLSQTLPTYVQIIQLRLDEVYTDLQRIKMPTGLKQVADQSLLRLEEAGVEFVNRLTTTIFSFFSHMASLLMAPIIAFYILKDLDLLTKSVQSFIPKKYRKEMIQLWLEINDVVSGFMRGQFLVALFISALTAIGLTALQVNFALLLALVAGAFNVIPYLGPILGAVPAVAFVLIRSPLKAVGVIILFVVIQQIESGFVSPRIMGDKVGLHPITVIFAILAGGKLGGIFGMILAVPIAGIVKVLLKFILEKLAEEK